MKKINVLYKNIAYFFVLILCTVFFVAMRVNQLFFLTDLNTGECYEFKFFEYVFLFGGLLFLIFSFLFFRFFCKPEFLKLKCLRKNMFLGLVGFLSSFVVLVCSFMTLFQTASAESISSIYNILFFITGVFFAIGFVWLSSCFCRGDGFENSLIMFSVSAFLWIVVRLTSFVLTEANYIFARIEFRLIVLESLCLLLLFFCFCRSVLGLNFDKEVLNYALVSWGFSAIFIIIFNVLPKLILSFSHFFESKKVLSFWFKKNLDFFNVYNFSMVDLAVAIFMISFLLSEMFKSAKSFN